MCLCVIQESADEPVTEAEQMDAVSDSDDELPLKPKKVSSHFHWCISFVVHPLQIEHRCIPIVTCKIRYR